MKSTYLATSAARAALVAVAALACAAVPLAASGQKAYGPGASDTEIRIGNTVPYSGPASSYSNYGKQIVAYFQKVNDDGGIRGRKINVISLDDAYSPPKTVEATRKLVEGDEVLLMFGQLGSGPSAAVQKYLNAKGVPQLFVVTGASRFVDPKGAPWTMPVLPSYETEGAAYATHLLETKPDAKIAVLYQSDDYGRNVVKGFRDKLGAKASNIVGEATYEPSDPSVDSQVIALKASGATVLLTVALPRQASQVIRKVSELGWQPVHYLAGNGASVSTSLTPAGLDKAVGVISANHIKDPHDSRWDDDPGMKEYRTFMKKYSPAVDPLERGAANAYTAAQLMAVVLQKCGDDLRRENVMLQAKTLRDVALPLLLPGIRVTTNPDDYRVIRSLQLERFDGQRYVPIGALIGS